MWIRLAANCLRGVVRQDGGLPLPGGGAGAVTRGGGCRRRRAVVAGVECCTQGEKNTPQEEGLKGVFPPNTWNQVSVHYGEPLGVISIRGLVCALIHG